MEVNKTCLDCKFALWGKKEGAGVCSWMFPFPLPKWLTGADILQVHGYNTKRVISKDRPHVECPTWQENEQKEDSQDAQK